MVKFNLNFKIKIITGAYVLQVQFSNNRRNIGYLTIGTSRQKQTESYR